jgi:hypothetical protein
MAERPILFSAPMVRAILEGRKTQTRRIVKPQPPGWVKVWNGSNGDQHFFFDREEDDESGRHWPSYEEGLRCPYGQPGARLWVREAWRLGAWLHRDPGGRLPNAVAIDYQADNFARREWLPCVDHELFQRLVKQSIADAQRAGIKPYGADEYNWKAGNGPTRWRPSIHMPRWASRITLEITDVRVERLQEISDEDAFAEGTPCYVCGRPMDGFSESDCHCFHRKARASDYQMLWESIHGPGSWAANPWVWVIEFKKLEQA